MGRFAIRAAIAARRDEGLAFVRRVQWALARRVRVIRPPRVEPARDLVGELAEAIRRETAHPSSDARRRRRRDPRPRIVHMIGSLQPGGAERQLCTFLVEANRRGHRVELLLLFLAQEEHSHFHHLLRSSGIPVRVAGRRFYPRVRISRRIRELASVVPAEFFVPSMDILGDLLHDPPDIFHSWLDHSNVWGGVSALFANVPLVVLSTRNVNPTHFPYLSMPYFKPLYQAMATSPSVRFINNSRVGARDYADWLGLPPERFHVVLNGAALDQVHRAGEQEVRAFRESLGLRDSTRIVTGIFRLSEEKQPLAFLETVRRLIAKNEDLCAVVAGVGTLQEELERFLAAHRLQGRVFLLGRRTDVATILSASSLLLLTSLQEGTPNVLLEAQGIGCPVVSTRAGGAVDAVDDGVTGFLVEVGDLDALEAAAERILSDPGLAARMFQAGPEFIKSRFGVERMVDETLKVYEEWRNET